MLIFTSSLDACHRVALLLSLWGGFHSAELSSALTERQRSSVLSSFRQRRVAVLVCSDVMSRGMDLEGVSHVVNYYVPLHTSVYVHRVGRTARGGGEGRAISLVKRVEYAHFISTVRRAANSFMKRTRQHRVAMRAGLGRAGLVLSSGRPPRSALQRKAACAPCVRAASCSEMGGCQALTRSRRRIG